jgi:uncharacterized membrane protein YgdD (TMEM256/DUF423 family)
MRSKPILAIAAVSGLLAVILGASGAHSLKPMLIASGHLDAFKTAVDYHFYHTFALLATGILLRQQDSRLISFASLSFLVGIILFSGSLYLISLATVSGIGILTPIGGLFFIVGWALLFFGVIKK